MRGIQTRVVTQCRSIVVKVVVCCAEDHCRAVVWKSARYHGG